MVEKVVIGDATLYLGDCRGILPGLGRFDLLLTDPPYGLAEKLQGGTWGKAFDCDYKLWDQSPCDTALIESIDADLKIIWGGNYFDFPPSRGWLIWNKTNRMPTMADAELAWTNRDSNIKVFDSARNPNNLARIHPTQKPIALMEWCLQQAGNPQSVLDPFAGSFSTGVACVRHGIKFVGIERERRYFDAGCKRIEQAHAQGRLFTPEPPPKPEQQTLIL